MFEKADLERIYQFTLFSILFLILFACFLPLYSNGFTSIGYWEYIGLVMKAIIDDSDIETESILLAIIAIVILVKWIGILFDFVLLLKSPGQYTKLHKTRILDLFLFLILTLITFIITKLTSKIGYSVEIGMIFMVIGVFLLGFLTFFEYEIPETA